MHARPRIPLTAMQQTIAAQNIALAYKGLSEFAPQVRWGSERYELLLTECKIAVCEATQTWDAAKGTFSTHAMWLMRSRISHFHSMERTQRLRRQGSTTVSLHQGDDDTQLPVWDCREISAARQAEAREMLKRCRSLVTATEWLVLTRHFRDGQNFQEIALQVGVSRERIRQVVRLATRKLQARYPEAVAAFAGEEVAV